MAKRVQMKVILKIGLAMIEKGRLLIVRKKGTELFLMPGGKPEPGEDDLETLSREIMEETSSALKRGTIKYFGEFADSATNHPKSVVKMKVYVGNIPGPVKPSNEIEECRWFDPATDDWNILSVIIKNHILPALQKEKLL